MGSDGPVNERVARVRSELVRLGCRDEGLFADLDNLEVYAAPLTPPAPAAPTRHGYAVVKGRGAR